MQLETALKRCNRSMNRHRNNFFFLFSTGFISREGDRVNPEEIIDIRNMIQKKLDRKKVPSTIVLGERATNA